VAAKRDDNGALQKAPCGALGAWESQWECTVPGNQEGTGAFREPKGAHAILSSRPDNTLPHILRLAWNAVPERKRALPPHTSTRVLIAACTGYVHQHLLPQLMGHGVG
jgi:hypothetical protein